MDALRQMAYQENNPVGDPTAIKFHKTFLFLTKHLGRMHEASLMGIITLWTMNLLADVNTILKMLIKGKAPLLPKPIKGRQEIKRIFERTTKIRNLMRLNNQNMSELSKFFNPARKNKG